jgi:hypothetical protein
VAAAGLSAAALHFMSTPAASHHHGGRRAPSSPSGTSGQAPVLTPISAAGFVALRTPKQDPFDENTGDAKNVLSGNPAGWATSEYYNYSHFGNLKSGTGLILDMGQAVRISSVTITFGPNPGTDVQLKVGNSDQRSAANVTSMPVVAGMSNVSNARTFTIASPVAGRYLVIWFTNLAQMPNSHNPVKYQAQVFSVVIHGSAAA